MTPKYLCDDDDLGCLHDYLVAAINGDDLSELPRLWNQQIGVIHSHPMESNQNTALTDIEKIHYNNLQMLLSNSSILTTDMQHALVFALECIEELRDGNGEQ